MRESENPHNLMRYNHPLSFSSIPLLTMNDHRRHYGFTTNISVVFLAILNTLLTFNSKIYFNKKIPYKISWVD